MKSSLRRRSWRASIFQRQSSSSVTSTRPCSGFATTARIRVDFCYVHRLSAGYQYGDGEWFPLRLGGLASHNRCTDPTRLAGGERVDFEFSVAVPDELTGEGTLVGYYELELPPACRGKESDGVPLASRTSVVFRGEDRSLHDGDT